MRYLSSLAIVGLSTVLLSLPAIAETTTDIAPSKMLISQDTSAEFVGRWTLKDDPTDYVEVIQAQGQFKLIISRPGLGDPFERIGILNGSEIELSRWEVARCGPDDCLAKFTVSPDGNRAELTVTSKYNGAFSWGEYQRSGNSSVEDLMR
jgi:hypothetical protein